MNHLVALLLLALFCGFVAAVVLAGWPAVLGLLVVIGCLCASDLMNRRKLARDVKERAREREELEQLADDYDM